MEVRADVGGDRDTNECGARAGVLLTRARTSGARAGAWKGLGRAIEAEAVRLVKRKRRTRLSVAMVVIRSEEVASTCTSIVAVSRLHVD